MKCKQGREWPGCKGIYEQDSFLVFVDFANKTECQRPDFYVLSSSDWGEFVRRKIKEIQVRFPKAEMKLEKNVVMWLGEKGKGGKPYAGVGVKPGDLTEYKENWNVIKGALKSSAQIQ